MAAHSPAPEPSSVLLYGGTVPSFGSAVPALRGCEMLIQRGVVASLGRSLTLMPGTRLLDITNHLVLPGLIAAQAGLDMWSLADVAADRAGALDDESAYTLGIYAAANALRGGVTTVQDGALSSGAEGLNRAFRELGLRVADGRAGPRSAAGELGLDSLRGAADADQALGDATLGAAKSLGLDGEVGSLTPGKWADVVILSVEAGELESTSDEDLAALALSDHAQVKHVLIAGVSVISDGQLVRHDLAALERDAKAKAASLGR